MGARATCWPCASRTPSCARASQHVSSPASPSAPRPSGWRHDCAGLGLRSEASTRCEKGLPPYLTAVAADRAAALIATLAGGTLARGIIDVGEVREERRTIVLPASEPRRLLGMDVHRTEIA